MPSVEGIQVGRPVLADCQALIIIDSLVLFLVGQDMERVQQKYVS